MCRLKISAFAGMTQFIVMLCMDLKNFHRILCRDLCHLLKGNFSDLSDLLCRIQDKAGFISFSPEGNRSQERGIGLYEKGFERSL